MSIPAWYFASSCLTPDRRPAARRRRGHPTIDQVLQLVGIRRPRHRGFQRDGLLEVGIGKALIERLHAGLPRSRLHRRIDLVDLVFADQVANSGRGNQDLHHHRAAAAIDNWARTCGCWCAGKTSTIRLMVDTAEFVCSVANVRWPVSAIRSADSMVSRSRISPISTTSGSSRSEARSELANECVSECTSRWLTRHFL